MPPSDDALRTIAHSHSELHALLSGISVDELEEPATIGSGEWSAKDLVGHLTTWEEIAITSLEEWRRGERPAIEGAFAANGIDGVNADEVARKSVLSAREMLVRLDEVHERLGEALRGISPQEWAEPATYATGRPRTLGSLLGGIMGSEAGPFEHFAAHQADLRAFSQLHAPG